MAEAPAEEPRFGCAARRLSAANAGKADYDDYTRAKTAFFSDMHG
jgi:dephospho-CoA kinase